MSEQNEDVQVAESKDTRKRVSYTPNVEAQTLTVAYDIEAVELPAGEELFAKHPGVKDHLAMVGLTTFLQRESSRVREAEKMDAIEKAYDRVMEVGTEAFERKPGGGPRGPRKAEKIAALAALKGATTDAVEKALAKKSKEEQDEILNSKKVLAKLEKMKRDDEDLDLAV